MEAHTGSTLHWTEVVYGDTHWINTTLEVIYRDRHWINTTLEMIYGDTHWINTTLDGGGLWGHTLDQHYTGGDL